MVVCGYPEVNNGLGWWLTGLGWNLDPSKLVVGKSVIATVH